MLLRREVLFCDINPTFYVISLIKERFKRYFKDFISSDKFANNKSRLKSKILVSDYNSPLIKKGKDIDPTLQYNKVINIEIACSKMNSLIINPGEIFSFWKLVGNPSKRNGFTEGRILEKGIIKPGVGGGLCNLANTIHRLVLHSPLEVVEFHNHSDALAPDGDVRIPLSSGTSVSFNNVDYRFKNSTNQPYQLFVWCADERLYAELRTDKKLSCSYRIIEEDHHFTKIGDKYFRKSKIYKETFDINLSKVIEKRLILDNHSEVMYDYSLINFKIKNCN